MMGYYSAVVGVLALAALTAASVGDNTIDNGERVVMVSPVLAPPQDSRIHSTVRARQFPILVLLAQRNPEFSREQLAKSLERSSQPIYVQKLEDQDKPEPAPTQLGTQNRQKRHLFKKHFGGGGGGGCYECNRGGGGYQQPTVIIIKGQQGGGGGYGHGGGYGGGHQGYNPCGGGGCGHQQNYSPCGHGGCGGGGGYGGGGAYASATATATANSYSSGYGKK